MKPRTSAPEILLGRGSGAGPAGPDDAGVLLREQGVYLGPGRSSWQIGELLLTGARPGEQRLWFVQPRGVLFDVPLGQIVRVAVQRKLYVVVRKPALAVTWQDTRLREPSTAWFLTPQLGQWVARLHAALGGDEAEVIGREERERDGEETEGGGWETWTRPGEHGGVETRPTMRPGGVGVGIGGMKRGERRGQAEWTPGGSATRPTPGRAAQPGVAGRVLRPALASAHTANLAAVPPGALERVARQVGPAGRLILDHLAAVGHAPLRQLVEVAGLRTDSEGLFCIRQEINPTAQALLGRPILHFVETQADLVTGEPAAFEWWLAGRRGRSPQPVAVEAEVFDEGERLMVVLEMVAAEPGSVQCRVCGERLAVTACGLRQGWRSEVVLPCAVTTANPAVQVRNGVVSIVLAKAG